MLLRANDNTGGCAASIDLSGDGKTIAVACSENVVVLRDAGTLAERKRLVFPDYDSVDAVRLSADARRMLIGVLPKGPGGGAKKDTKKEEDPKKEKAAQPLSYEVIEVASGKRLFPASGPRPSTVAPDLSPDGEWVASASGQNIDLWRVADGSKSKTCLVGDKTIIALAFDESSMRMAVANGSGALWLVDPATCSATEILSFGADIDKITLSYRDGLVRARIAWKDSRDQEIESRLQVWSEREKKVVVDRTSHADAESPFDFIPDGGRMLVPDSIADNVVRFVDAPTQQEVGKFTVDAASCCYLTYLRFYPDRHRLLTGWNDRGAFRLRLWQVLPAIEELRGYAKAIVPECLSSKKRGQLGLDPDPPRWCIELGKQPYDTAAWKQWLADKAAGKAPPLPSSGTK
jgi:WD40 repeat protein